MRFALRRLLQSPAFATIAVVALALGIGANVAIFSVIDSVFLRPLPFPQPEKLVRLTSSLADRNLHGVPFSFPRFTAVRDQQQVFSNVALGVFTGYTVTGRGDPEEVRAFRASADYLRLLGVQPVVGRSFSAEEDQPGGASVALISHAYWRERFNRQASALGQPITLNGQPHTIVGILPPALSRFPFERISVWTPRPAEVTDLVPQQLHNGAFAFEVLARLKPGVTLDQAREQVNLIAASYGQTHPKNVDAHAAAHVNPLLADLVGDQRRMYVILFGAVGCVLLIACANVANLLLARFISRRKEIALRFALGASRRHVVRQLLAESLLVAFAGAALGLLLAYGSLPLLTRLGREFIPRALEISIQPSALAFTTALALLTGLAMGLLPAFHAAARDVHDALKESSRGSSSSVAQGRLRSGLLVAEIALSLVLLIAAALLLSSFSRLQKVHLGFQPERILVGFLNVPPSKYPEKVQLANLYERLLDRLSQVPGVVSVALNDAPPLSGNDGQSPIAVVGRPIPPLAERDLAMRHIVSPGSFATLGITLQQGRDFNRGDNPESPHTVIINEALAKRYFPGENPLGQRLITGMAQITAEIVGVVSDTRSVHLHRTPGPEYFLPALQRPEHFSCLMVRSQGEPSAITTAVRSAMREVDPDLPLIEPRTMPALIAQSIADRRLVMTLLGAFAGLAVILASIGIYSVMAYVVTQRTSEIGIRMALGASPGQVLSMILGQGMKLAAYGIAVGLIVAFVSMRVLQQLLFEVKPADPLIYAALTVLISLITALACWLPARRATQVDPATALRAE